METYPQIDVNYLDTFVLDDLMLVSYPCFIAFGKPTVIKCQKLKFQSNSYFKIVPAFYKGWINYFKKIMKHKANDETPFDYTIFKRKETIIKGQCKNELYIITLEQSNVYFEIKLTLYQVTQLFYGLHALFFSPFLLPKPINLIFVYCVSNLKHDELELISFTDLIPFSKEICKKLKIQNKMTYALFGELFIRYKNEIILNLQLLELLPESM